MTSLDKFKLTAVTWDSDREPEKYSTWDYSTGSMTRATQHGAPLEDWFDAKIGRVRANNTMPSIFENDPELAGAVGIGHTEPEEGVEAEADTTSSSGTSGNSYTLGQAGSNYMDLPKASRVLDGMLYNVLLMNVKGTKSALLRCVKFPSYVLARIVLHKHMDISRNERKTKAIAAVDMLSYTGDPHAFQVQAVTSFREYFDADTKPIDFALSRLMKAFEGKSQATQHKIAHDMNTIDITEMNLFDLIQSYCADLASVGGNSTSINSLNEAENGEALSVVCSHCSGKGHSEANCRRKGKSDKPCSYCGKKWHTESECFKKKKTKSESKSQSPSQSQSPEQSDGQSMNVELATLLQQAAQQQSAVNSIQPAAQPAQSAMSRETITCPCSTNSALDVITSLPIPLNLHLLALKLLFFYNSCYSGLLNLKEH